MAHALSPALHVAVPALDLRQVSRLEGSATSSGRMRPLRVRSTATWAPAASDRYTGRLGSGGGAGVLEKPGLDQSEGAAGPQTEEGGERGQLRDRVRSTGGDRYRVLLLDHANHTESLVAKLLPKAVPAITPDLARRAYMESKALGAGLVIIAPKEYAEMHAQMMARVGLRSTIEPDGPVL